MKLKIKKKIKNTWSLLLKLLEILVPFELLFITFYNIL